MWDAFEERDRRFIVQAYRIVEEQLFPPFRDKKKNDWADAKWKLINDRLSTELGLEELSKRFDGFYDVNKIWRSYVKVCMDLPAGASPDEFIKVRLSFVEIAFREREVDVKAANDALPDEILRARLNAYRKPHEIRLPGNPVDGVMAGNRTFNERFQSSVDELNTRLQQAGFRLNYHNGYVQRSADEQVEAQIETPFWRLVADPKWRNVETDMATAIDTRDTGGRDTAWHAAKALESTIKIISDGNGWTHGRENGPHNYIENLASKKNGRFIDAWEMTSLKQFFTDVRRPFGHGAGSDEMPKLTDQQTNWAIEFCMTWVKSLVERASPAS